MAEEVFKELVAHARYLRAGVGEEIKIDIDWYWHFYSYFQNLQEDIKIDIYIFVFAKPGVSKDGEEGVKELRKKAHSAGVWHAVQHADPGDEELTDKPIDKEENEGRTFNFPMFSG